jgi:hypothetical protein
MLPEPPVRATTDRRLLLYAQPRRTDDRVGDQGRTTIVRHQALGIAQARTSKPHDAFEQRSYPLVTDDCVANLRRGEVRRLLRRGVQADRRPGVTGKVQQPAMAKSAGGRLHKPGPLSPAPRRD